MKKKLVIGLNSGTSMDGIDAALFKIQALSPNANPTTPHQTFPFAIEHIESYLKPFELSFQKRLKHLIASQYASLEEICLLNTTLGELFAEAGLHLIKKAGLEPQDIDLIGSHGQTLWHCPQNKYFGGRRATGTLQLGELSVIAARTGIPVIGNFRVADLAEGGQGAPLVAFADQVLFAEQGITSGILNLGGIANITLIDGKGQAQIAFDTGPANVLIDRAATVLFNQEYDYGGKLAAAGKIDQVWLATLLSHAYFQESPPKTTGRELFGDNYADELIAYAKVRGISPIDCISTLTALTAHSVAQAYQSFLLPKYRLNRLILGGGGADNATLIDLLKSTWPHPVKVMRHEDFGISSKFKEALLFALLAYTTNNGIPNNVPSCTGARRTVCLGQIAQP